MTDLTRREREVVELVGVKGLTYIEAAEVLRISVDALKARVSRAYRKLGAGNCREAVAVLKRHKRGHSPATEQAASLWGSG